MTTIYCGHDFSNTRYCIMSHLVIIKLTLPFHTAKIEVVATK